MKFRAVVIAFLITAVGCARQVPVTVQTPEPQVNNARNVILVIADGFGPSAAGVLLLHDRDVINKPSILETISRQASTGWVLTQPKVGLVTDSAAAATSLATGELTLIQILGISSDGRPLPTLLERAQAAGKMTALITNARITDATPAAFASHVIDRDREDEVAEQMLQHRIPVMLGGGLDHFIPQNSTQAIVANYRNPMQVGASKRKDTKNLIRDAEAGGYKIVTNRSSLLSLANSTQPVLGLFSMGHIPFSIDREKTDDIPSLSDMFLTTVQMIDRVPAGFFMMIEAGRIDMAAHVNDPGALLGEMLEYDNLIDQIWNYQATHPDTLVVMVSDHETGAPAFVYNYRKNLPEKLLSNERYTPTSFSADETILKQIRRQKRSVEFLTHVAAKNTGVLRKLIQENTAYPIPDAALKTVWEKPGVETPAVENGVKAGTLDTPETRLAHLFNSGLLLVWATTYHTHTPVPLFAFGPGSARIRGIMNHAELSRHIGEAIVQAGTAVSRSKAPIDSEFGTE